MKGSIRIIVGLLLVYGAVGGMDHGPFDSSSLLAQIGTAIVGLALMAWGTTAIRDRV
jgi:hypothetical protein